MKTNYYKILLVILLFYTFKIGYSQEKEIKIFFNNNIERVDSIHATYYEIFIYTDSIKQKGLKKKFTIDGKLIYEVEIANFDKNIKSVELWERNGKLKTYFDNGNIKTIKTYKRDTLNGPLVTFYKSGKNKRNDTFKNGKFIQGECFAEDGSKIKHFDYEISPKYKGGKKALLKFIKRKLKYPKKLKNYPITGKVYVIFTVSKDGTIGNISTRASNKEFEKEAIRVVKLLKNWEPGKRDGEYDDFKFSLPITFGLR